MATGSILILCIFVLLYSILLVDQIQCNTLVEQDNRLYYQREGGRRKESSSVEEASNDEVRIVVNSNVGEKFSNKRTFACPRVKPSLHTGDSMMNISPEDIDIVAAMGDSLASGRGLWEGTDVDFRGAAFPIGGDATIDGLVTIPNILLEFNDRLEGVSHGMGSRDRLPYYQFNVAISGSETENLPEQANELVNRLHLHFSKLELRQKWALIIIATGTEEFCVHCDTPDHSSLRRTLGALRKGIPKAFVVLLGPVHVASSSQLSINLLKPRCPCLENISRQKYNSLVKNWKDVFVEVQNEFNNLNYSTFGVLAISQLTIHSRDPETLFDVRRPLLNRKGHTYAAKWLWNRLITGPNYNLSDAVFSEDNYFCPSVGCPYFRTNQNFGRCSVMSEDDYQRIYRTTVSPHLSNTTAVPHRMRIQRNLLGVIIAIVVLSFISVSILGTIFYRLLREATRKHIPGPGEGDEEEDRSQDPNTVLRMGV